jgi:ABC-2 type transport system ATP-binding protein
MIQTHNLVKKFGAFTAVDRVNLLVQPGEIYGFLGPNGAGKTTTLLMLIGMLPPTSGRIEIFGQPLRSDPFGLKRRVGVVVEAQSYYDDLTAWEYLMFFGRIYGAEDAEKRGRHLLERVGLWEWRDVLVGGYSTGMQRKLGLVRALLHSPDLLLLDEPVASLDPYGIRQVRELLGEEHAAGRTILISSHILSEIERTATRVGIIVKGRLLLEDTMDHLRQKVDGGRRIELELADPAPGLSGQMASLPFVRRVQGDDCQLTILSEGDRDYRPDLARWLASQGVVVQGLRSVEASLEEAFITITEESARDWAGKPLKGER